MSRKGRWMHTIGGTAYWPLDPRVDEISIGSIAHSLGMLCRYNGHVRDFYSVAEHSVHVSYLVPPEFALEGLMHDGSEAYVSDVTHPVKPDLVNFKEIEDRNWKVIAWRFHLQEELPFCVRDVDRRICLTEMAVLTPPTEFPIEIEGPAPDVKIHCWDHRTAKEKFLERFRELWWLRTGIRNGEG